MAKFKRDKKNSDIQINSDNLPEDLKNKDTKRKSKKAKVFILCAVSAVLASVITIVSIGIYFNFSKIGKITVKLNEIDSLVSKYYTGDVDYDNLDEELMSAYISAIEDKYGFYKSRDDAVKVSNSFEGSFDGIGVTVYYLKQENCFYVRMVDSSGPSDKAGIKPGDKIVSVDGKTVKELGANNAIKAIKKENGQTVSVGIIRSGKSKVLEVKCDEFIRQTVYYHKIGNIGYINITSFNAATVEQFNNAVKDLDSKNVKGFVFDLRDNGGGTVDSVMKVLETILPKKLIMTVKYADGKTVEYKTKNDDEISKPMSVIVNENTASASEIFSAALRDLKKSKLIGNTTYGKGVMQRTFFLSDGSCVRFTVAKFISPAGTNYNGVGLKPDVEVNYTKNQAVNPYALGDNDPYIIKACEATE